jgi:hypothetical protein
MYLVAPDGDTLGYGQNQDLTGKFNTSLSAYTVNPVPGTWTLIVVFAEPVEGNELADSYTGSVKFNVATAKASGLPDSSRVTLAEGTPVTIPVTIKNNGPEPEDFFVDPRLNSDTVLPLASFTSDTVNLPMNGAFPVWVVPSETSALWLSQTSSVPGMFDFEPAPGDPDLSSSSTTPGSLCSTSESAFYAPSGGSVTPGEWLAGPSECGPYAAAAPAGTATITATAITKKFDPAVTSTTGDLWTASGTGQFAVNPVVIAPGASATIHVTITPSAEPVGTVVRGTLYVDDLLAAIPPYSQLSGDEVDAIPYEYKVG